MLVFPSASSGVSLFSFTTVIHTPVGIESASISLMFLISNGIIKCGKESNKHRKITLLNKTKLNNIENNNVYMALIDFNIIHNEFTLVVNEKKCFMLKVSITANGDQIDDIEKNISFESKSLKFQIEV